MHNHNWLNQTQLRCAPRTQSCWTKHKPANSNPIWMREEIKRKPPIITKSRSSINIEASIKTNTSSVGNNYKDSSRNWIQESFTVKTWKVQVELTLIVWLEFILILTWESCFESTIINNPAHPLSTGMRTDWVSDWIWVIGLLDCVSQTWFHCCTCSLCSSGHRSRRMFGYKLYLMNLNMKA